MREEPVGHYTNSVQSARLMKWATYASVGAAASIIVAKFIAWTLTGSLTILSSFVDSILDVAASLINMVAVHYALVPADEDHRFGHGKAEDIASLLQAAFITGSALFISVEAAQRFVHPQAVENGNVGIMVMVFSTIVTAMLLLFQRYVIRKTKSNVIKADALHYLTDLAVNLVIIASLGVSMLAEWQWFDPLLALIIAAYIIYGAWHIARKAFDNLMDKEFDNADREKIISVILSHPECRGTHDLRTRWSGLKPFIQFHLELDGHLSLHRTHQISDEIEAALLKEFPTAEVIIHQDPDDIEDVPLAMESVKAVP